MLRLWRNNSVNSKYLTELPYITRESQQKWYERTFEIYDEYVFGIEEISELQCLVGSLAIYNITEIDAEVGKILIGNKNAHGKKVGVNSLSALLDFSFNQLKLKSVYLHVYKENIPAVKVYTQVGFSVEKEYIINGKIELKMSISQTEFFNRKETYNGSQY